MASMTLCLSAKCPAKGECLRNIKHYPVGIDRQGQSYALLESDKGRECYGFVEIKHERAVAKS